MKFKVVEFWFCAIAGIISTVETLIEQVIFHNTLEAIYGLVWTVLFYMLMENTLKRIKEEEDEE